MEEGLLTTDLFALSQPDSDLSVLFPQGPPVGSPAGKVYFLVTLRGNALVEIDGHQYRMHPNAFLFILPGHLLRCLVRSDDFSYRYLMYSFDFMADFPLLLKTGIADLVNDIPCLPVDDKARNVLVCYLDFIGFRFAESPDRLEVVKGLLFSFVLEVSRLYSDRELAVKSARPDKLVDRFFALLHKHYRRERTARFYADMLCVSDKHLMRNIKQQTGYTVHYWIADFVLREAKVLLKSTDKNVSEISDELRFPNSSFFARFFRKYVGISPQEYRKLG